MRHPLSRPGRRAGFTLIELLLVVSIIGILASLAVQRFSSVKNRAYFAAMRNDLRNLYTQMEIYYDANSNYATFTATANTTAANAVNLKPSQDVTVQVTGITGTNFPPGYTASANHLKLGAQEYCAYAAGATYSSTLQIISCSVPQQ